MIKNLVLSGGATRGIVYIGVLKYLEEIETEINNCTGTSVGALFALFIVLGYTALELQNILLGLTNKSFVDISFISFFEEYGLDTGKKMEKFIHVFLKNKGFSEQITFAELFEQTGKTLTVILTNLNKNESEAFNHTNTPDTSVAKAVQISANIPILYGSKKIKDEYYIDGAFSKNLALDLFKPSEKTLGIMLLKENTILSEINDFIGYTSRILECISNKLEKCELKMLKEMGYNVFSIDVPSYSTIVNFNLDNETKTKLIDLGYLSIKKFLSRT